VSSEVEFTANVPESRSFCVFDGLARILIVHVADQ